MPPVSASNALPVPSKIVMKGNSTMTLHERFSDISPPKIDNSTPKIAVEPTVTARLDIGRKDFVKRERTPRRNDDIDDDEDFADRRTTRNGNIYSMKNRREMTPMRSRSSLSRRLGTRSNNNNSLYEALRDQRTNLRQRLGAKGRLGGGGFRSDDYEDDQNGWRSRRRQTPAKVSPFDDLDTIFRYQRMNGVFRNNRVRSRFSYRGFQKRRFGFRRNAFPRFGTPRFRNRRFGNNSMFRKPQNSRNGQQQQEQKSREELDDEIDAYMAKTKLNLDNDLDAYMADV